MSVSHALLGVLAEGPAHGYDLKRVHDDRFPGTRPLAFGQVYAALAKLERDGLVEVVETVRDGGPERTVYSLTDRGAEHLAAWLDSLEAAGPYAADDFVRKAVTALRLDRDAAGYVTRQRQVHLAAMKELVALQESTDEVAARVVLDHAIEHLDADLRWLATAATRMEAAGSRAKAHR
jgi:DNA-binding PadR family transcriptional regulator